MYHADFVEHGILSGENGSLTKFLPQATPIWLACFLKRWSLVPLLLAMGADPNVSAISSAEVASYPIYWASIAGEETAVTALMEAKASLGRGMNPLEAAWGGGHTNVVAILKRGGIKQNTITFLKIFAKIIKTHFQAFNCPEE